MPRLLVILATLTLIACNSEPVATTQTETAAPQESPLATVLDAQSEKVKARYQYRHPQETLEFFGIEPGMTVMEALPGGGWYSKILLPYLGKDGHLIGADYDLDMYAAFGFYDDERLEKLKTWVTDWTADAESWRDDDSASVSAFVLGSMPGDLAGSADAVLFIRALHNLNNYESDGGYLTAALSDAYALLKPGGIVGVVQHQSSDEMSDEWADGSNGYLKKSLAVERMEAAGFEFVSASSMNENSKDRPGEEDFVWRLPPSFDGSEDDPGKRDAMQAIGESNRMTLKFRRPE
jgi:predicted methyltransferase